MTTNRKKMADPRRVLFLQLVTTTVLGFLSLTAGGSTPVPAVLWHGMGDSCCNPLSLGSIKGMIEKEVPGIYVRSLKTGTSLTEDIISGFLGNANEQVSQVCSKIQADPKLKNGYNAVGFSQGGQFLRAVAQRCPSPQMYNLVSIGGQHQGVFGFPHCPGSMELCKLMSKFLSLGAYTKFVQDRLIQAQYWHDPTKETEYKKKSIFLADINQELENVTYKNNLLNLKNLVLVKFLKDTMVIPKESEWFGYYRPGNATELYTLWQSPLYKEDLLGLRELNNTGRLHLLVSNTDHLKFEKAWFQENIINGFLK